jgi:twitching motility two-component system response regulator PilH
MAANKALVVDDSTTDLSNIKAILQEAGWMVTSANNGTQAIERAKADKPNIIFMDIVMPQLDGYGTSRALAEDPATKGIPVVFVSTKSSKADQVWARAQGGKALITKPFSADQIVDALKFAA